MEEARMKAAKRRAQNRAAAKRSKLKKKTELDALCELNELLMKDKAELAQQLVLLRAQVRTLEHAKRPPPPLTML